VDHAAHKRETVHSDLILTRRFVSPHQKVKDSPMI